MNLDLVSDIIGNMGRLHRDALPSLLEGIRRAHRADFSYLEGYVSCLIDYDCVLPDTPLAMLPATLRSNPSIIGALAAAFSLDLVTSVSGADHVNTPPLCAGPDIGDPNHIWLRMEGGQVLGGIQENERYGCVPLFKNGGSWHFSAGPYGVVEMFYMRYGVGFDDDSADEVNGEKDLSTRLSDEFQRLLLASADQLATAELGTSLDIDVRVDAEHYRIKLTSVVCDRYGNEV